MRSDPALFGTRRRRADDVLKRLMGGNAAQAAGFPLAQVVLHAPFARFAEKAPGLPGGAWHHRDFRELAVGVFGTVAAAQRFDQANDFAALFKTRLQ